MINVSTEFILEYSNYNTGYSEKEFSDSILKVLNRLEFGQNKYGVPLTTETPIDSLQMAWEEAFDGCQYLLKAHLEGKGSYELFKDQLEILIKIEKVLAIVKIGRAHV